MKPPAVPLAERRTWPKLSETLPYPRRPDRCQGCGIGEELVRYVEGDEWDARTTTVVVLCRVCEKREIKKHPRLYFWLDRNEPRPGAMALCVECRHRAELRCCHPQLKANGGAGLVISFPKPVQAIVCPGGPMTLWQGPPTKCAGRELVDDSPGRAVC